MNETEEVADQEKSPHCRRKNDTLVLLYNKKEIRYCGAELLTASGQPVEGVR